MNFRKLHPKFKRMQYWLLKTEPETFSWEDLVNAPKSHWDGVRNYQARNNLKAMQQGDLALVYYSGKLKGIVGIAEIEVPFYQDPTTDDDRWVAVGVTAKQKFESILTLEAIKQDESLSEMVLLRNSRLSVQPVSASEFDYIMKISGGKIG